MRHGGTLRQKDGRLLCAKAERAGNIYSWVCHKKPVISPPNCELVS